jgi:hypothetical protein
MTYGPMTQRIKRNRGRWGEVMSSYGKGKTAYEDGEARGITSGTLVKKRSKSKDYAAQSPGKLDFFTKYLVAQDNRFNAVKEFKTANADGFTFTEEEEANRFPNSGEVPNNKDRTGPPTAINHALSKKDLTKIIKREATLRGMDVDTAVSVFGAEGLNTDSYQSEIKREGKGSKGGYEASWGVTQLYTGGGLGNEYEKQTGRKLISDNTKDGAETQIKFSLDKAVEQGWGAWSGAKTVGVKSRDGLSGAKAIYNWKDK